MCLDYSFLEALLMGRMGDVCVKQLREILRLRLLDCSQRQIARSVGLGRTTVQDVLHRVERAGITPAEALSMSEEELLKRIGRRGRAYTKRSDEESYFEYVHRELRKRSMTLALLWEEYREQDPENSYSYSTFCARYGEWKKARRVWMRQSHRAGEKMFIDFCGDKIGIVDSETGEITQASIFVAVLGASNYCFAQATWAQDLEAWLSSQRHAFEFFGGVARAVVPDNPTSIITKSSRYEPLINETYSEFARHYGCAVLPARVKEPKDKAKVELGVQLVQRWIIASLRRQLFFTLYELNLEIRRLLEKLNRKVMRDYGVSRQQLFQQLEQSHLLALPSEPYVFGIWKRVRVGVDYHVEYERNRYSVPYTLARKEVELKASESTIEIYYQGERVFIHLRSRGKNALVTIRDHMPSSHKSHSDWDIPRLLSWAQSIGPETSVQATKILEQRSYPEHAIRPLLGLLSLSKRHGSDRLEAACARANRLGIASMSAVANMLKSGHEVLGVSEEKSLSTPSHDNVRGREYYH